MRMSAPQFGHVNGRDSNRRASISAGTGLGSTAAVWIGSRRLFDERQRLRLDRLYGGN
jgi:hypothetical protein